MVSQLQTSIYVNDHQYNDPSDWTDSLSLAMENHGSSIDNPPFIDDFPSYKPPTFLDFTIQENWDFFNQQHWIESNHQQLGSDHLKTVI